MEGCDSPVVSGKDNGCGIPPHQQWTELNSAHLPDKPSSMEQPAGESHGPLDGLRAPFPERLAEGAGPAAPPAEPASKEVSCSECSASFASLQTYMEHHCPGARPAPPLREESASDTGGEEGDEESDVENLAGEIVYQPDGSAYIVESLSQLSGGAGAGGGAGGSGSSGSSSSSRGRACA